MIYVNDNLILFSQDVLALKGLEYGARISTSIKEGVEADIDFVYRLVKEKTNKIIIGACKSKEWYSGEKYVL